MKNIDFKVNLTLQRGLCWVCLFLLCYAPPEIVIETIGFRGPFLLLVSVLTGGSGSDILKTMRGN